MAMKKLSCPHSGQYEWANSTGKDPKNPSWRCTKCGEIHSRG